MDKSTVLEYFDGVFESLGVEVEETGESFTIKHAGDKFTFINGVDSNNVDFIVPLKLENIENMIKSSV